MDRKKATALSYDREDPSPRVIAQGRDALADRIVEIAKANGISVVQDPVLADILGNAEIGTYVPPETWEAVAAIFAFLAKGTEEKWFT